MKFEHVLGIYWTKGFLYNSTLIPFFQPFNTLFNNPGGSKLYLKKILIERFELYGVILNPFLSLIGNEKKILQSLNIFFSQYTSVNGKIAELNRYTLLRLYLIKSMRGFSHALGKPSRGQRT